MAHGLHGNGAVHRACAMTVRAAAAPSKTAKLLKH